MRRDGKEDCREGKELLTIPDLDVVRPDGAALSKPCEEAVDVCAVCHD